MSTNESYIGMVMYDIPVDDGKARREYTDFRKNLLGKGYYQIQESIYVCKIAYESTIKLHQAELKKLSPKNSNIRMIILTKNQFNSMHVIAGRKTFFESILSQERQIIEL